MARDDVRVSYCGTSCVFHELNETTEFVRHGTREGSIAALHHERLYLNIRAGTHPLGHPLHLPEIEPPSVEQRAVLLRAVAQHAPSHVEPIHGVCSCGFVLRVAPARPVVDEGNRPGWHRRLFPLMDAVPLESWSFGQMTGRTADLAEGLSGLERIGVAHGDPYLFNALLCDKTGARWVDFNDMLPATPSTLLRDRIAFLLYCVRYLFSRSVDAPHGVVNDIISDFRARLTEPLALARLAKNLRHAGGQDNLPAQHDDDHRAEARKSTEKMLPEARRIESQLLEQGFMTAYNAWRWNFEQVIKTQQLRRSEQIRHQILERELGRTLEQQALQRVSMLTSERDHLLNATAELKTTIDELYKGKDWLEQQWKTWKGLAEDRERQIAVTNEVADQVEVLRLQNKQLQESVEWYKSQKESWESESDHRDSVINKLKLEVQTLLERKSMLDSQLASQSQAFLEKDELIHDQLNQAKRDADSLRTELDTARQVCVRYAEDMRNVEALWNRDRDEFQEAIRANEANISRLSADVSELTARQQALEVERQTIEFERQKLQEFVQVQDDQLMQANRRSAELNTQLANTQRALDELRLAVQNLRQRRVYRALAAAGLIQKNQFP